MSTEENKALARRYFDEENSKNVAALDEIIVANFVGYTSGREEVHSPEGLKQLWTRLFAAFPDYRASIDDIVAEGDKVAVRFTNWGTHKGEWLGAAPTGKQITWTGMLIFRMVGGKVTEAWREIDKLGLIEQMGAIAQK
jgi:predicted ester cyclase